MTEKISRRGVRVPSEYGADLLEQLFVHSVASHQVVTLIGSNTLEQVQKWIHDSGAGSTHQGFPVVDDSNVLLGILTRRDLLDGAGRQTQLIQELIRRPPVIVYDDCTLREAVDHMVNHDVGRLPVVKRGEPGKVVGIITRSDVLSAYRHRLRESRLEESSLWPPRRSP